LFSPAVLAAYENLMGRTFATFGIWGEDARIKSNAFRRRQTWLGTNQDAWMPEWDRHFTMSDSASITGESLQLYRRSYDELIAATVRDLDLTRARAQYTTKLVSLNAHAPRSADIEGSDG
jgi:hypothetical protein